MHSITPIGITDWRDQHQPFGIKDSDRLGHMYCLGKTGSGKSTLILNMAISDVERGNGLGLIDPHGDLSEQLLNYIPVHRISDVVYLNAFDKELPIGFNPLASLNDSNRYIAIASIVTALKRLFAENWGPRLEYILRNTLLTLSYYSKSTMLDIAPLLTNKAFRTKVLYALSDQSLQEYWRNEFEPLTPQLKQEFVSPIINKVGLFTAHPVLRIILGQSAPKIDFSNIMDNRKIFIANLSKGILGEAGATLLGALLISHFQTTAMARVTKPLPERTPFFLYIDEAHSFITKTLIDILSEARKFGLSLFLTHQFFDQLPDDIQKSILGNVGTLIAFRLGSKDAKTVAEEFYPVFNDIDLINLPRYHISLKLLIDGATSKPFSAISTPLAKPATSSKATAVVESQKSYGISVKEIEQELEQRQAMAPEYAKTSLFQDFNS